MTYKQEEFEVNGIEVTIQQVRSPSDNGEPKAWLNGGAAYAQEAKEVTPIDVSDLSPYKQVKAIVAFMVDNRVRFCPKCETFRDVDNFVSTGFAGRKCQKCDNHDNTCEDGGEHDFECLNPGQKHNARVPTKYKCQKCGYKKSTTPTG